MRTTYGKVYKEIADDDNHGDILYLVLLFLVLLGSRGLSNGRRRASGRFSCFSVHTSLVV